jgi:gluconolactonase
MVDVFYEGLLEPEGPVQLDDGRWAVVEMSADRGSVTVVAHDGSRADVLRKTGRPNGLALGADGTLWVAESERPSLLKVSLDGDVETVLTENEHGQPFLFPNDLAFGPDGSLYLTDSGIGYDDIVIDGAIRSDWATAPYDGRVYRIDPTTRRIETIDSGLKFLNGISVGPDNALYTNDTISGDVYRYSLDGGSPGPRERFSNVVDPALPIAFRGPDGMAHSADGRLFVTVYNQHDIVVLGTTGEWEARISAGGRQPTNAAFSHDGRLMVTEVEHGRIEIHDVGIGGAELFRG